MTKYQYIYYSKVEQKWKMTEKAYESMPKFESIVDHIQKFVPEEMIDSAKSNLDDYTPPAQNPDEEVDCDFAAWWDREGSGMITLPNEGHEEFAKRVSEIAWQNGFYKGAMK